MSFTFHLFLLSCAGDRTLSWTFGREHARTCLTGRYRYDKPSSNQRDDLRTFYDPLVSRTFDSEKNRVIVRRPFELRPFRFTWSVGCWHQWRDPPKSLDPAVASFRIVPDLCRSLSALSSGNALERASFRGGDEWRGEREILEHRMFTVAASR